MTNNILEEKIYNFTDAVRNSLENKNWYAALTLALKRAEKLMIIQQLADNSIF
jgi:hypothetical protein